MSGWIFLAIGLAVTFLDFALGLYLLRRGTDRPTLQSEGMPLDANASARAGRLIMFVSPLFLMIFVILAFGWIPAAGIEPITLD